MELNVWTGAELAAAEYDDGQGRWSVRVRRAGGPDRVLEPRHLIVATGVSGKPFTPEVEGREAFRGSVLHSAEFTSDAAAVRGDRVVIVGACNSSHDIAHELYERGAEVTMVQRSETSVASSQHLFDVFHAGLYGQDAPPVEEADFVANSLPIPVALDLVARTGWPVMRELDAEMHAGLARAGFKVSRTGLQELFLTRGGGYYIEVGASELIIDRRIKIKHGVEIKRFTPDGVVYSDNSVQPADVVIFATGYANMREIAVDLLGDAVAERCSPVWGLDDEGELRSVWRRSGFDGLWFMGGNLALVRPFSKVLALQIKAIEEGIIPLRAAEL
jgi:putative flavoprotein involved in K+ transport